MAKGLWVSEPIPVERAAGSSPRHATRRGHHDGTQPQQRRLPGGGADIHPLLPQFVDVGDQNDGGFHGNAQQRQQAQNGRDAEGRMGEFERHQRAHRLGHEHAQGDADRKLEVPVEGKQDHENQPEGERTNEVRAATWLRETGCTPRPTPS